MEIISKLFFAEFGRRYEVLLGFVFGLIFFGIIAANTMLDFSLSESPKLLFMLLFLLLSPIFVLLGFGEGAAFSAVGIGVLCFAFITSFRRLRGRLLRLCIIATTIVWLMFGMSIFSGFIAI